MSSYSFSEESYESPSYTSSNYASSNYESPSYGRSSPSPSPSRIRYNSPSSISSLSPTPSNIYSVRRPTQTYSPYSESPIVPSPSVPSSVRTTPSVPSSVRTTPSVPSSVRTTPSVPSSVRTTPLTSSGSFSKSSPLTSSAVRASPSSSLSSSLATSTTKAPSSVRTTPSVPSSVRTTPSVPSSVRTTPLTFPPQETASVNEEVENLLISNGYKPIKYIVVDNENNKNFILATNKRGQYVLVNLNGRDTTILGNIIHTEQVKNENTEIPYSLRKGSLECSNGVCGIAYEGDKELVTITRDHLSLEAKSETLVYKGDNVATIGNNIPIPIINYIDIVHDAEGVLLNTCETTKRLYSKAYENCKVGMSEANTEFKLLEETLKEFVVSEGNMATRLAQSMVVLNNLATQYEREPPMNDKEHRNYEMVKFNLRKRNDLFIILVNCCNQISSMKNNIVELTQHIREMQEMCEREFAGVDKVMTF